MCLPIWGDYIQNVYLDPTIDLPDRSFPIKNNIKVPINCLKSDIKKEQQN